MLGDNKVHKVQTSLWSSQGVPTPRQNSDDVSEVSGGIVAYGTCWLA